MTGSSVTVDAQWALYGKSADREGFHVLACSAGDLSSRNFADIIGRFRTGTPEALPQVTVSYVSTDRPGRNYLALAIQDYARSGSGREGGLGRPADFTEYFCLPYQPLADAAAGYCDLYAALQRRHLPASSGPPLPVSVTAASLLASDVDLMTTRTAALLLTGRPVCVLGAQDVDLAGRLAFIDAVMALLPYGFRAKMTAATWTRAVNQNHRFRLFFSGTQRDTEAPDNIVHWGQPEETVLTPEDDLAYEYESWLSAQPELRVPDMLPGLTRPRSFTNRQDVLEALDEVLPSAARLSFFTRTAYPSSPQPMPVAAEAPTEELAASAETDDERLLLDCARYLDNRSLPELSTVISRIKSASKARLTPAQRTRYGQLIAGHRLLRHDEAFGHLEAELRKALMKLAFNAPIGYEDYCLIEDGAGAPPDPGLLQLIEKKGVADDDRVKAITYWQWPAAEAEQKLAKWYASGQVSVADLLNLLMLDSTRPRHARLICEVTIDYLSKADQADDPREIDRILRKHSYLGPRLQSIADGQDQYQVDALGSLLSSAYPTGLSRGDLYHVMVGTNEPVTRAFLVAVLLSLADREDAQLARELYTYCSILSMSLKTDTKREVEKLILPDQSPRASGASRR